MSRQAFKNTINIAILMLLKILKVWVAVINLFIKFLESPKIIFREVWNLLKSRLESSKINSGYLSEDQFPLFEWSWSTRVLFTLLGVTFSYRFGFFLNSYAKEKSTSISVGIHLGKNSYRWSQLWKRSSEPKTTDILSDNKKSIRIPGNIITTSSDYIYQDRPISQSNRPYRQGAPTEYYVFNSKIPLDYYDKFPYDCYQ